MAAPKKGSHNDRVWAFFEEVRKSDPARYAEVCAKYPTLSNRQWRVVRERETPVGLLGLQPAHISEGVAHEYGLDSCYMEED